MGTRYVWNRYNLITNYEEKTSTLSSAYAGSSFYYMDNVTLNGQYYVYDKRGNVNVSGSGILAKLHRYAATEESGEATSVYYATSTTGFNVGDLYWILDGSNLKLGAFVDGQVTSFPFTEKKSSPVYSQGTANGKSASTRPNAYPQNGRNGNYWYVYDGSDSIDPVSVSIPSNITYGQPFNVTVSPSTSIQYGGIIYYTYQVSINGGSWTTVSNQSTSTILSYTTQSGTNYIQFRVVASDSYGYTSSTYVTTQTVYVQNPPEYITIPEIIMQGTNIEINWGTVYNVSNFILQRQYDSGGWAQIYTGTANSYTDSIGSWSTVQYQVCGVYSSGNGPFAQSSQVNIVPASVLVISGQDGDLGTITSNIQYSIATDTGNSVQLVRTVNGAMAASLTVENGFSYSIPIMDLPTGTNTIVITATVQNDDTPVTVTRTWTYTKSSVVFPSVASLSQLTQGGINIYPTTIAEAVKAIGGPWGGNLSTALDKLAMAATWTNRPVPVTVDMSMISVGDIVNLPVNGVMVPHIVVQVGNPDPSMYDSSCNGVWLLRKDIVENGQWNSTNVNTLAGSTIMTIMQGYVTDYDSTVQSAIQTVKIPYCVGNGSSTVNTLANGLECKFFPLSGYEVGFTTSNNPNLSVDGAVLSYFQGTSSSADNKRIAYLNGVAANWWLRSSNTGNTTAAFGAGSSGSYYSWAVGNSVGLRPCFTLPTTFTATYYVDAGGNVYPSQEYTTAGDFYDLWGNVIPTAKIATGTYTGTGTYGSSNPNSIVLSFIPKWGMIFQLAITGVNATTSAIFPALMYKYSFPSSTSNGYDYIYNFNTNGSSQFACLFDNGLGIEWYGSSATAQMNVTNAPYHWIFFG